MPDPVQNFGYYYPTVEIPLGDLREGYGNTFKFTLEGTLDWGYTCIYGLTLRIYYDQKKAKRPQGRMISPVNGETCGDRVRLVTDCKAELGFSHVDFVGRYTDVNYECDDCYRQWHYRYHHAKLQLHCATAVDAAPVEGCGEFGVLRTAYWDTRWVPDQEEPMEMAARITDASGLVFMTESVKELTLGGRSASVALCKPYDVPLRHFGNGMYKNYVSMSQKFDLPVESREVVAARLNYYGWNSWNHHGFMLNDVFVENSTTWHGTMLCPDFHRKDIMPLRCLKKGPNVISTIAQGNPDCVGMFIHWPGIAVLVQHRQAR